MQRDPNILNELKEIAPILSKLERKNPFKVPTDYFQDNAAIISKVCQDQEPVLSAKLRALKASNPFKIPTTYFEDNAAIVAKVCQDQEPILSQQLQELKKKQAFKVPATYFEDNLDIVSKVCQDQEPVLSQQLQNLSKDCFKTPDNYFENLSSRIQANIEESGVEADANLKHLRDDEAMRVPEGYFGGFADKLMARIKEEEAEHSDLLESLKEKESYKVPKGYFETFPQRLAARIEQEERKEHSKVVQMQPVQATSTKDNGGGLFKLSRGLMAVAAVLTMMVLGTFLLRGPLNNDNGIGPLAYAEPYDWKKELAELSDSDLKAMVQSADLDEFSLIENINDVDIFTLTDDSELELIRDYLLEDIDDQIFKDLL